MFTPDYICIFAVLAMLSAIPVVWAWPDGDREFRAEKKRECKQPKTIFHPGPKEETKR